MAKKADRPEPKKECPSCGLGVAEQAMICEFCGWDFEEEDEWILQIEKLERDLMLEKQRYEPGTVNHMIESTLRSPMMEKVQPSTPTKEGDMEVEETTVPARQPKVAPEATPPAKAREAAPVPETSPPPTPSPAPRVRRVRTVRPSPASPAVEPEPVPEPEPEPVPEPAPARAAPPTRTVRRVKSPPPVREPTPPVAKPTRAPATAPVAEEAPVRKTRVVRKVKK